jgi:hypothetical protein
MQADAAEVDAVRPAGRKRPSPARIPKVATSKTRLLTLDSLDRRTGAAKRAYELVAGIANDLGGAEHLTEGAKQLVQRVAVLAAFLEDCEARWIAGEPFEISDYLPAINAQRRILETLGIERRARDVTTLESYLAQRAAATRAEAAGAASAPAASAAPPPTGVVALYDSVGSEPPGAALPEEAG